MKMGKTATEYLSKKSVVANLNDLVFGRSPEIKDLEHSYKWLKFRKGMMFKNFSTFSGIPESAMVTIRDHPIYSEGLLIILPYQKGSEGYNILYNKPLMQNMKLEGEVRHLNFQLSEIIRKRIWLTATSEGMEKILLNLGDIVQRMRTGFNVFGGWEGTAMIPPQPLYIKKPRAEKKSVPGVMPT